MFLHEDGLLFLQGQRLRTHFSGFLRTSGLE